MQNNVEHVDETSGESEGFIKTPRQLVTVIILAFLIPIVGILLLVKLVAVTSPMGAGSRAQSSESIAERIQPVAHFKLVEAAAEGGDDAAARTGEQVYDLTCATCHATGVAGAPALGDNAAWAPLIDKGFDALVRTAIDGVGAMPPRGGNPSLSDLEVARAVAFMANNSGASFDEPSDDAASGDADAGAAAEAPADTAAQATPDEAAAQGDTTEAAQADAGAQSDAATADDAAQTADAGDQAEAAADSAEEAPAAAAGDAPGLADIQPILAKNACLACHAVDNKLVGPSYRDVAEKYAGDAAAADTLAQHIKGGSSGVWGPIPMPPNPGVSDDELQQIVSWIMAGAPE
ncbi:MAG TPA: c-type cytochrome [Burkholderiaceae bacterium]|nr:c-type cytochrome [Burkholderiaceae bacterium]